MATLFDVTLVSTKTGREYQIYVWKEQGYPYDCTVQVFWIRSHSWFRKQKQQIYFERFDLDYKAVEAAKDLARNFETNSVFTQTNESTTPSNS